MYHHLGSLFLDLRESDQLTLVSHTSYMDPKPEDNFFITILEIPSQPFRPSDHHVSLQNCFVVPYEVYTEFIFTQKKRKRRE
jgi:hypothetical protein